jgi:GT2 family glycosyltransferase
MKNDGKMVSVIFANYNGLGFLKDFLDSIYRQTHKNFEIIMVDNDSRDESVKFVGENYPEVKIIENKKNSGYAGGNNIGFKASRGEFIAIVNNDIVVKEDLLEKLLDAYDEIPNLGAVQPKVELANSLGKMDSCGSFWTNTGLNYHYGIYKDTSLPIYNKKFPIYSLKGVFMLIPRKVIEKVGLFDDDYWCYFEETDFCHRVWLSGLECWYYPTPSVLHRLAGTSSTKPGHYVQFHSFKNRLCSYLKNLGGWEMIKVLPVYFFMNFCWSIGYLAKLEWRNFLVVYKALWWNIENFSKTLKKRKHIQKNIRKKTDREIFSKTRRNPRLSYYFYLLKGLENYKD